jgi:hypothetical protein
MTMTRLQMNLKFLNFYFGNIDGIKGPQTAQAIREYRLWFDLGDSYIADQKMIDSIRDLICRIQSIVGVEQDGVAGAGTAEATRNWQESHGLAADGICGTKTREAMFNTPQPTPSEWDFPHFKKEEFNCPCCGMNNINYSVVALCEDIRAHFGDRPMQITSGCRCAKHNSDVGGVAGSRHVLGKAVDFVISGVDKWDAVNYCQSLVNQGRARYTYTGTAGMGKATHVDIL